MARGLAEYLPWARALGAQARLTACRLDRGRIVDAVEAEYTAALHDADLARLPAWPLTATAGAHPGFP